MGRYVIRAHDKDLVRVTMYESESIPDVQSMPPYVRLVAWYNRDTEQYVHEWNETPRDNE